jgi:hypothetical protein
VTGDRKSYQRCRAAITIEKWFMRIVRIILQVIIIAGSGLMLLAAIVPPIRSFASIAIVFLFFTVLFGMTLWLKYVTEKKQLPGKFSHNVDETNDEQLPISVYLRKAISSIDGIAWLIVCVASLVCLIDILLSTGLIPIRDSKNPSKAIVLLLFSPLIVFLVMVRARQLPFSGNKAAIWFRAVVCIFVFLIINF